MCYHVCRKNLIIYQMIVYSNLWCMNTSRMHVSMQVKNIQKQTTFTINVCSGIVLTFIGLYLQHHIIRSKSVAFQPSSFSLDLNLVLLKFTWIPLCTRNPRHHTSIFFLDRSKALQIELARKSMRWWCEARISMDI